MQLFVDCDGVLANFNARASELLGLPINLANMHNHVPDFWERIYQDTEFYFSLPLMPDAMDLWNAVKHLDPVICTGLPKHKIDEGWAEWQKRAWKSKYFPGVKMITCLSRDKCKHMQVGDVLVDDRVDYRHLWIDAGGIFVHHIDTPSTLIQLKNLGIL